MQVFGSANITSLNYLEPPHQRNVILQNIQEDPAPVPSTHFHEKWWTKISKNFETSVQ